MALIGKNNEEKIWNYLKSKGFNNYGIAGIMGNLYAESGLRPNNLQNTYEKKLGYTDDNYTIAVDNNTYSNFVRDSAGYGLAQWTYWSRKQNLLDFAKSQNKSIGDLEMQLDFLYKELSEGYKTVFNVCKNAKSVLEASNAMLLQYERPANQSESVQTKRASYGQVYYDKYAITTKGDVQMGYTNSSLVNCVVKSPNHSGQRTHRIDRITPHCVVGQLSAESIGGCFTSSSRQASCNYGIGKDGRVCLIVDEANRSWCTSSNANDQRAITIEVASDKTHPYAFTNEAYEKLVELCIDICRRNGIKKLLWLGTKEKSLAYEPKDDEAILTAHRWFANKSCPGDWMYSREGDLANRVTAALGGSVTPTPTPVQPSQPIKNDNFPTVPFLVQVIINDLNYRSEPSMKGVVKGQTGKGSFTIVEVSNGWGRLKSGAGWIYLENPEYCTIGKSVGGSVTPTPTPSKPAATSYRVKITANALNIRKGPGTKYGINGVIRDRGVYTIVEENSGWGKLKSGAGWISLSYTQKL